MWISPSAQQIALQSFTVAVLTSRRVVATAVIANLIIGFVNGVTQGFGIPISRCFGAGDYKNMRRYVAGSFIMTVAMTLILTVCALLGIEGLLHILDTPADIMEEALQYIRIIIMGTAFISLYNSVPIH